MQTYLTIVSLCFCLFFSCKTSDSPQSESPQETVSTDSTPTLTSETAPLNKEEQHQFDGLLKQGDANYASGNFREALHFYKKAQAMAPDQLGNEKLIACIKAMQVPSTRRKSKN